jgi:prepilin-type N-terminal cleavage/methylation domain-containing protein
MRKNLRSGFSILEMLVVLTILSLVTIIIVNVFASFRKSQALDKDTETIVEVLRQARSQTISSINASQYGVRITSSKATLFTGATYSSSATTNQDFLLQPTDTIVTISLTGGGSDVVFNRISGETGQYGTVVISSPTSSRTKTVTIYKTGLVEVQ